MICSQSLNETNICKMLFLFFLSIFSLISCKKTNSESRQTILPATKQITFKIEEWKVYPYFGGPGEDSMYNVWSPEFNFDAKNITQVVIKSKSGSSSTAPLFVNVSQKDDGYVYQPGEQLGKPKSVLLWWIQKQPGDRPDADSAFISFK